MSASSNLPEVTAKVICGMKGEPEDGRIVARLPLFSVVDEPAPGFLRNIWIGEEGVQLFVAELQIFIPIQELWAVADAARASMADRFIVPAERASSPILRAGEPILGAKILKIISAGSVAISPLPFHEAFSIADPAALRRTVFGIHGVSVQVQDTQILFCLANLLKLAEAAVPAFRPSPGRQLTKIAA